MINPILAFYYGKSEEVGGDFFCEECQNVSHDAQWHAKTKILSWTCPECGHKNQVENMDV